MGCGVCGHVRRAEIEAAAGEPSADLLEVALRFGVTIAGLTRHEAKHPRAAATTSPADVPASPDRQRRAGRRAPLRNALVRVTRRSAASETAAASEATQAVAGRRGGPSATPEGPSGPPPSCDDESPATSRSAEISVRRPPRTAREKAERLVDSLQRIVEKVVDDPRATLDAQLAAVKSLTGPLRLLGTFTGEIGASESTVASSPFYRRVRAAVVEALRAHPAAAREVISALERVERGEAAPSGEAAAA